MTRFMVRVLAAVVPLTSVLVLHAPVAAATPVITYLGCESGGSKFFCTATVTNTVGVVTRRWDVYQYGVYLYSITGTTTGMRGCHALSLYTIKLHVTDDTGTVEDSAGVSCNPGSWP